MNEHAEFKTQVRRDIFEEYRKVMKDRGEKNSRIRKTHRRYKKKLQKSREKTQIYIKSLGWERQVSDELKCSGKASDDS